MYLDFIKKLNLEENFFNIFEKQLLSFIESELKIDFVKQVSHILIDYFSTELLFDKTKSIKQVSFIGYICYVDKHFKIIINVQGSKEVMNEIEAFLSQNKIVLFKNKIIGHSIILPIGPQVIFCKGYRNLKLSIIKAEPYSEEDLNYIKNEYFRLGYFPYLHYYFMIYHKLDSFSEVKGEMQINLFNPISEVNFKNTIDLVIKEFVELWNIESKLNLKRSENKRGVEINNLSMKYKYNHISESKISFNFEFNFSYTPILPKFFERLSKEQLEIDTILLDNI